MKSMLVEVNVVVASNLIDSSVTRWLFAASIHGQFCDRCHSQENPSSIPSSSLSSDELGSQSVFVSTREASQTCLMIIKR